MIPAKLTSLTTKQKWLVDRTVLFKEYYVESAGF